MDSRVLALGVAIAAALIVVVQCTPRNEGFRTILRVDRDTIPLQRGQKYFPRKPAEADVQGPIACHDVLGAGYSYQSWEPAADKRAGGAYQCFRNVYKPH